MSVPESEAGRQVACLPKGSFVGLDNLPDRGGNGSPPPNRIAGHQSQTIGDPVQEVVNRLRNTGCDPHPNGPNAYESRCPVHEGTRHNLSVSKGCDGRALLHCHHTDESGNETCSVEAIVDKLGMTITELFPFSSNAQPKMKANLKVRGKRDKKPNRPEWDNPVDAAKWIRKKNGYTSAKGFVYRDHDGTAKFVVYRFDGTGKTKSYRPIHLDPGSRKWRIGDPDGALPLYNLPDLATADHVCVVEGEKCADLMKPLGLVATTSSHGAGSAHKTNWNPLAGKSIVIFPDADDAGKGYANETVKILASLEPRPFVKTVRLPGLENDGGDIEQWIQARVELTIEQQRAELERLIEAALIVNFDELPGSTRLHDGEPRRPEEADNDPARIAKTIHNLPKYFDANRLELIKYHHDHYNLYRDGSFRVEPFFVTTDLVCDTKAEVDRCNLNRLDEYDRLPEDERGKPPTAIRMTRSLSGDVNHFLAAISHTKRQDEPPFWINPRPDDPDPVDIVSARNGLIDLSGKEPVLKPHTPRLFSTFTLPYAYDPEAPSPRKWLKLLGSQWATDPDSIDSLHEIIGNLLTPETKYQKIHLLIGPTRSGRGTIARVLTALIGERNVVSTSPATLSGEFGLEPLLGKTVAIMGDARAPDKDASVLMDRLLRISGCDAVDVNRKGIRILSDINLRTRFLIISNEMPNFRDASGAIVGRYHILKATRTIPPEDRNGDLDREIIAEELPGILNLAIKARERLRERGRFVQPESASDLLANAEDMASPVKRFVDDQCLLHSDCEVGAQELFEAWRSWTSLHGYHPGNSGLFGKNFRAAFPGIKHGRPRDESTGKQKLTFFGVALDPAIPREQPRTRPGDGDDTPF